MSMRERERERDYHLLTRINKHWCANWVWVQVSILKMTQNDAIREYYIQRHACQDMLVPNHKVAECLEFCHENFEVRFCSSF